MKRAVTIVFALLSAFGAANSAFGITPNEGYDIDMLFDADDPQTAIFALNPDSEEFWSMTFCQPGIALIELGDVTYRAFPGASHFRTYNLGDTISSGYGDEWTISRTLSLGNSDDDVLYLGAEPAEAATPLVPIYTGDWLAAGSLGIMVGARYRQAAAYTQITNYQYVEGVGDGEHLVTHHPYTAHLDGGDSGKPIFVVSPEGDAYYIASHYTTGSGYSPIPDMLALYPDANYIGYEGPLAKYIDIHPETDVTWSFVPEPATLVLLAAGGSVLLTRRRRRG